MKKRKEAAIGAWLKWSVFRGFFWCFAAILLFGLGLIAISAPNVARYMRGPIPLESIWKDGGNIRNEYVSYRLKYRPESYMINRSAVEYARIKEVYYIIQDMENRRYLSVRMDKDMSDEMKVKLEAEKETAQEEREGFLISGTMERLKGDAKLYYDKALTQYGENSEDVEFSLHAGTMVRGDFLSNYLPVSLLGGAIAIGGLVGIFSIFCKNGKKDIEKFLAAHPHITREQMEDDFAESVRITGTFRIGTHFTYSSFGTFLINQEISRVYLRAGKKSGQNVPDFVCIMKDGKEQTFPMFKENADIAVDRYRRLNPDIAVGNSIREKAKIGKTEG